MAPRVAKNDIKFSGDVKLDRNKIWLIILKFYRYFTLGNVFCQLYQVLVVYSYVTYFLCRSVILSGRYGPRVDYSLCITSILTLGHSNASRFRSALITRHTLAIFKEIVHPHT